MMIATENSGKILNGDLCNTLQHLSYSKWLHSYYVNCCQFGVFDMPAHADY